MIDLAQLIQKNGRYDMIGPGYDLVSNIESILKGPYSNVNIISRTNIWHICKNSLGNVCAHWKYDQLRRKKICEGRLLK